MAKEEKEAPKKEEAKVEKAKKEEAPLEKPKIGVYVCHCGINIKNTVDVDAVRDYAATLPNVVLAKDYMYVCSDPEIDELNMYVKKEERNKVESYGNRN